MSDINPDPRSMWDTRLSPTDWTTDLVGYEIEATDGSIGHVEAATTEVGAQFLVIDAGGWLRDKKVMLPAGVITSVDHEDRKIFVDRTKRQIKDAPEFDEETAYTPTYREKLGGYYGPMDSGL